MARRTLPPGVTAVPLKSGELRYRVVGDAGVNPATGRRAQSRKSYPTLEEALVAQARLRTAVAEGSYVQRSRVTVGQLCADYLASRHKLRATSAAKDAYDLAPFSEQLGDRAVQSLTRADVDKLVTSLREGGTVTAKGGRRRPWSPSSVNKALDAVRRALDYAVDQGVAARNVAAKVERVPAERREMETFTAQEVRAFLASLDGDRIGHAWHLALSGLRREEVCGLRWRDVDLDAGVLRVVNARAMAGGRVVEGEVKTERSRRTLPLPGGLAQVLRAAQARQRRERLALGPGYGEWDYVVSNEAGGAYNPVTLTARWAKALGAAGVRRIRLHDARHTCATLMHLNGVPMAVISAWVGHSRSDFTMRQYTHSQADALKGAANVFDAVVTTA